MGTLALICLGSNLGDRKAILDGAIAQLRQTPDLIVRAVSTYHETKPAGGPVGQRPFLNAAAALETTLEPIALLHRLQEIEADAGRVRTVRWGERTLDLDVLLFGAEIIDSPELRVPHPYMGVRKFVLVPLEEVGPDVRDPLTGRSIRELRANLDRRPSYVALEGWWCAPEKRPVIEQLVADLQTGCWSQRDLEEFARCGVLGKLDQKPFGLLEKTLEFLVSPSRSSFGDRWIVTDFTVADLVAVATGAGGRFPGPSRARLSADSRLWSSIWSSRPSSLRGVDRPAIGRSCEHSSDQRHDSGWSQEALASRSPRSWQHAPRLEREGIEGLLVLALLCYAFIIPS